jgi:hypothetical protein
MFWLQRTSTHIGRGTPWYFAGVLRPLLHPLHPPAPGMGWSQSGPASALRRIDDQVLSQPHTCEFLLARISSGSCECTAHSCSTQHTNCAHAPAQSCPAPARLQGQQQIVKLPASTIPDTTLHIAHGASNQSRLRPCVTPRLEPASMPPRTPIVGCSRRSIHLQMSTQQ